MTKPPASAATSVTLATTPGRAAWVALALVLIPALVTYWAVLDKLVVDWSTDENYSHGFLVIPLAAYFVWERRGRLASLPIAPDPLGILVIAASLAVLIVGTLGAEMFTTRVSFIGLIAGLVLFLLGRAHLRTLLFPIAFLLLMVPIPAIVFNQIAFPLQLLASRFGETTLRACTIPVLREGNVIVLANTSLEVAEACSGIRSLISLLTLGIVYGYFADRRPLVRILIALATIPIAIVANGLRVAGTGVAAHYYGPEAAQGFFHTFSGWLVFIVAFAFLLFTMQVIRRVVPGRSEEKTA